MNNLWCNRPDVYPQAGQYTITVIVGSQRRNAVVEGETLDSALVQSPSLAAMGGFRLTATAGIGISNQVVATFHDPLDTGGHSANVEFGDGSSAPGTISAQGGGNYKVLASHLYDSGLTNGTITVIITRTSDGDSATVSGTVVVAPGQPSGGAAAGNNGGKVGGEQPPSNLGELAGQLANSAEAYGDFVFTAYEHYLGRHPDGTGLSHWVSLMQQGLTDEQLEANFLAAPEYVADHGGSDVNWVIGMYHDLLGRAADGQGLAYWAGQIGSGVPECNIALGFAASAEREAAVVQADYSKYLLRGATPEDIDYWVNQFLHGARNEDVIAGFVGSQEYYANPTKGNADRSAWLDRAFDDLYNRLPSDAELSQWLAEMD